MTSDSETAEIRALLLAPALSDAQVAATLRKYGIRHPKTADANLQSIAGEPPTRLVFADLLPRLLAALARTADPDMGLNNFQRFSEAAISRESLLHYFLDDPDALELLLLIFTTSQHLSDILIQNVRGLDWIRGMEEEPARAARERMLRDLRQDLTVLRRYEHRLEAMRQFKNIETLKIGMRDLVHEENVENVTRRLSALAEAELQAALDVARDHLAERRGVSADDLPSGGLAVIGLGKLGGGELNYSSDVDILFVYEASAKAPKSGLSRQEFYEALARLLVEAMTRPMVHGHVFRVDVRLRPDGHMGELVCSDAACLKYYGERGAPWERQALIKARCVAGDMAFGERLVADLQRLAYDRKLATGAGAEVRQMKDRIEAELGRRAPSQTNVKLGQGGIRDIEFIVQLLQLQHGWRDSRLRIPQTLGALRRLREEGIIAGRDADVLGSAYVFLRTLEHRLQMMHSLQIHSLPHGEGELQKLAIRMGFEGREAFLGAYERHTRATREIFERFVPR